MNDVDIPTLKEELCRTAKSVSAQGLVSGHAGNLSLRLPDRILITPHGVSLDTVQPGDILTVDFTGAVVMGTGLPSMDTSLHLAIYDKIKVNAIVHTHPLFTNALTIANVAISPLTVETAVILRKIPVVSQKGFDLSGHTEEIITSLTKTDVVIIKHHGVLAIGDTLRDALILTQLLEENAKMTAILKMFGVSGVPPILL